MIRRRLYIAIWLGLAVTIGWAIMWMLINFLTWALGDLRPLILVFLIATTIVFALDTLYGGPISGAE